MLHTPTATRGMVVAPHHLAAQAGVRVLRDGGNAIEAMVAAAATIAVVYPHMNSLGGDNFWLISDGQGPPIAIDACGAAATKADEAFYRRQGYEAIPSRGPLSANTVAGAVSGWLGALQWSTKWGGTLPLLRLFEDAEYYAREGFPVSQSQNANTHAKSKELGDLAGFVECFLRDGRAPATGSVFRQPALGRTLRQLGESGLDDFYRGELARVLAAELTSAGSPITTRDLEHHHPREVRPLAISLSNGTVYNLPPPTQGLASLIILGLFERQECQTAEGFEHLHGLVEATKCAFQVRDAHITDPTYMEVNPENFLSRGWLDHTADTISPNKAAPWGTVESKGDTVWLGTIESRGRAVSFIQSIYWEFGSGVLLPETGVLWQNRGTSFDLSSSAQNHLVPGRKPFHTIQAPLAFLNDGRLMVYGAMGGEGQPQTQSAVFTRYVTFDEGLQPAVTAPRWLLGRTWGHETTNLRIENRFRSETIDELRAAGHEVELVEEFDEVMGHAGALVRHPDGLIEGAADPRSDGLVAAF